MSTTRQQRRQLYEQLVGQTVADRYEITRLMGFGGMGAVYEAIQQNMNRHIALKYIPSHDPVMAARFEREALTVSQLRHPNTVTVFDYGRTDDGFLFLTMEMLEGLTLTDVIKEESPLAAERVVHIASQICRSLGEAHGMGIVHRDVKPDNVILITVDGDPDVVKVLDFGIAKAISGEDDVQLTGDGRIVGTPRYMSPEQILSEEVDHRSDIYSLGCIIFEMLCGAPPFQGSSTTALMISHAQDAPPAFAERLTPEQLSAIPPALEHVVRRAMAKSPVERPQTTDHLRRELEEALQAHETGQAIPYIPAQSSPPGTLVPGREPITPAMRPGAKTAPAASPPAETSSSNRPLILVVSLVALLVITLALMAIFNPSDDDDGDLLAWAEPLAADEEEQPPESSDDPEPLPEVSINDTVHIRILSDPTGASILDGSETIGTTPYNVSMPIHEIGPMRYTLRSPDHQDKEIDVEVAPTPGDLQEFSFELERVRRPVATSRPTRNTRVNREPEEEEEEEETTSPADVPLLLDDRPSTTIERL